jgi:hypothetical protein
LTLFDPIGAPTRASSAIFAAKHMQIGYNIGSVIS